MEIANQLAIDLPISALEEFCQCWQIQELAVFGSVLRSDFSSSLRCIDADLMVDFHELTTRGDRMALITTVPLTD